MLQALIWGLIVLGVIWFIASAMAVMIPYVIAGFVVFVIGSKALDMITSEKPEAKDTVINQ